MTAAVWGDPLSCHYEWIQPEDLASYADEVRHVSRKVAATATGLETMSTISESLFAGATADSARGQAGHRAETAAEVQSSLRDVADAIREHAEMLADYREALDELLQLASDYGLEVRERQVWPPDALPSDSTRAAYDTWIASWRSYRTCFDLKTKIEAERHERSLELARAVTASTGVPPEPRGGEHRSSRHGLVDFGRDGVEDDEARHRAAERARHALEVHDQLDATHARIGRLRQVHRAAAEELQRLAKAGAAESDLTAQAREVRLAAEALRAERAEIIRLQAWLADRTS